MPRPPRAECVAPTLPNHVILRGNNQRNVFSYGPDRGAFVRILQGAAGRTSCQINAAALLKNHVHLLVTPPTVEALSACVQAAAQTYAQWRNHTRGATGKLWQQRFFSKPVTDDEYLATVTAYIDLNLEHAGVPRRHAGWTTYGLHLGISLAYKIPHSLWTPSPWYLALGDDARSRVAGYDAWQAVYRKNRADLDKRHELDDLEFDEPDDRRRLERPDGTSAR